MKIQLDKPAISSAFSPVTLNSIQFRVHRVPLRRALEGQRDTERRTFVVQPAREHNCLRQVVDETAGHDSCRMPGQVCDQ